MFLQDDWFGIPEGLSAPLRDYSGRVAIAVAYFWRWGLSNIPNP